MTSTRFRLTSTVVALGLVLSLAAAACGSDDSSSSDSTATTASSGSTSGPGAFAKAHYTTDLSKVCPNPIIVQKDWLAEAEHGAMYQMIGGGGEMSQNDYKGPLGSTGVDLEILDGGPGLGDGISTASSLYAGNLVMNKKPTLAFVGIDDAAQTSKKFPVTGVFAALDKSPTMLMYDPTKYHDLKTVADVKKTGADLYVTSKTLSYVQYLMGQGIPGNKIIEGYAGDKEKFIASGGKLINQGYVSNEVYSYEHETDAWNKPVDHVLVYDLGYKPYPSVLSVRTDKLKELAPCLKKLVPIMQHAQADYIKDPAEVNKLLTEYNPKYSADFWFTSKGLSDAAVKVMKDEQDRRRRSQRARFDGRAAGPAADRHPEADLQGPGDRHLRHGRDAEDGHDQRVHRSEHQARELTSSLCQPMVPGPIRPGHHRVQAQRSSGRAQQSASAAGRARNQSAMPGMRSSNPPGAEMLSMPPRTSPRFSKSWLVPPGTRTNVPAGASCQSSPTRMLNVPSSTKKMSSSGWRWAPGPLVCASSHHSEIVQRPAVSSPSALKTAERRPMGYARPSPGPRIKGGRS